jgi:hypothetical protein
MIIESVSIPHLSLVSVLHIPIMKSQIETVFVNLSIDQLKGKINLNVDDMDKLTVDDLRSQVDYAFSQVSL